MRGNPPIYVPEIDRTGKTRGNGTPWSCGRCGGNGDIRLWVGSTHQERRVSHSVSEGVGRRESL